MATQPKKVAGGVFPGHPNTLNADPLVERDGEASSATVPVLDPDVGRAGHGDGPAVPQGAAKAPSPLNQKNRL